MRESLLLYVNLTLRNGQLGVVLFLFPLFKFTTNNVNVIQTTVAE